MTSIFMRRPHLREIPTAAPLPSGYVMRQAFSPEDDAPLAATLTTAFAQEWGIEDVRAQLTAAPDVRAVYAIMRDGQVAATASHRWLPDRWPASGCIHWVGTHPAHARIGLASALIVHLLHDFAACGYRDAVLETQSFRLPALRAYLRFGFLPVYDCNGEDHRAIWSAIFPKLFAN